MQSNEKKIIENLKVQREKDLLKKLKRREKEAKSNSERKRIKKSRITETFDKIVAKKVNDSSGKSVKNVTFPKRGKSKCLDFKNPPNDKILEREESAEENSQKGLLLFISGSTSLGENSHFPQNSREKCTQFYLFEIYITFANFAPGNSFSLCALSPFTNNNTIVIL